ncbi:hypothetical protein CBL_21353, partial [Carabus blaptoides fortunei]
YASKVCSVITASQEKYEEIVKDTYQDECLIKLRQYITMGWPENKSKVNSTCKVYWDFKDEIIEEDGLLFKGNRLIVPTAQKKSILTLIHKSHQGINSCINKAKRAYYWPNMTVDIQAKIEQCKICQSNSRANYRQPLTSHEVKELSWEKLGMDFAHISNKDYLIIVDYHSKFVISTRMFKKRASD